MKNWLQDLWDNVRIITGKPQYVTVETHYEAAWTESWMHRRCMHNHPTLIEAAKCAMPSGCGWYVVAVEGNSPRHLTEAEERIVNEFRFAPNEKAAGSA
jgi:hypothetical protein